MQVDKAKCLQNTRPSDFVGANPTLPSEMILTFGECPHQFPVAYDTRCDSVTNSAITGY